MDAEARTALRIIRRCVAARRYSLSVHFAQRLDERRLYWPDVVAMLKGGCEARSDGKDRYGRPKWIVSGVAHGEFPIDAVCALDKDDRGDWTVFITIY